jgi:glycerol-3-phosphate dehydrogenase
MPFLIPTYRHLGKPKWLLDLACKVYDLLSLDRNRLPDPQKRIPSGRLISRQECSELLLEIDTNELTGGAVFYDALIHNSERLGLSMLRSAANGGAVLANYAEAFGFLQEDNRITGVKVRDLLTDDEVSVRAKTVVNMSGPWVNEVLAGLQGPRPERVDLIKTMYLAVKRPVPDCAVGLIGSHGKYFFVLPWHDHALIGIAELPCEAGDLERLTIREQDIEMFIADINRARPSIGLRRDDVVAIRGGLLPADKASVARGEPKMPTRARIIDHSKDAGIDGLVSAVGIKYTMARSVAERVIDLVFAKLGHKPPKNESRTTRAYGGEIDDFGRFLSQALASHGDSLGERTVRHLVLNHGSAYGEVLEYVQDSPDLGERLSDRTQVLKAEVVHAVREEMAEKLADVVFRRTELGLLGNPGQPALSACAGIMAQAMGWDQSRTERELGEVNAMFSAVLGVA